MKERNTIVSERTQRDLFSQEGAEQAGSKAETHVEVDVLERLGEGTLPDEDNDPDAEKDGSGEVSEEEVVCCLARILRPSSDGPYSLGRGKKGQCRV